MASWIPPSAKARENYDEVMERMEQYMGEFEAHGTDHISVDVDLE